MDIGIVLFPNPNVISSGVAYSYKYALQKIDSLSDFDSNIVWFTNLNQKSFNFMENIKSFEYFGFSYEDFLNSMGLDVDDDFRFLAKELIIVCDNIVKTLSSNYKLNISEVNLPRSLYNNLSFKNFNFNDSKLEPILKNIATLDYDNKILKNGLKEIEITCFKYEYVKSLCKTEIPIGNWMRASKNDIKALNSSSYLLSESNCTYCFIGFFEVLDVNKNIIPFLPPKYKEKKLWLTSIEYNFLIKFFKFKVLDVYMSMKKIHLEKIEPNRLFRIPDEESYYFSHFVSAYNYYKSFMLDKNILSLWLDVQNNINFLKATMVFNRFNFDVITHNSERIKVGYEHNKENADKIIKICDRLNLSYPLNILFLN